ncbi:MAG: NAD-dependent epimerase/dehydratase family protein [Desulfobacterales bacterium]
MIQGDFIIDSDDLILITGSNGFIGSRVVETLLRYGFRHLRCFVRPSSNLTTLNKIISSFDNDGIEVITGNLLSRDDCKKATEGVSVIFHLAAGVGKSFPACFLNSVVTIRNLLDTISHDTNLKRFLNVSSFAVYSNLKIKRGGLLDETCEVESQPQRRGEAYCYAKAKQDDLLLEYNRKYNIPYVIVRPGAVYGPGKNAITGRVGIGTFGIYLHMGGSNRIPFTYVDNCAFAIVLAGIKRGVDGEVFNIVDDDLPKSKEFLKMYKAQMGHFTSIPAPYMLSYFLCYLWEKYSEWSQGQLPLVFNRSRCAAEWKGNRYSNDKLKDMLGWQPRIPTDEALKRYFEYSRQAGGFKRD